jgi:large subunit ribosomal protein L4
MTTTPAHTGRAGSVLRHTVKKERSAPVARTAPRRNAAGHDLGTVDLEPTVFGLTPNRAVLHQVVTAQLAAVRAGTQSTRTRAEVRGGGAKPFRQKGTGRARQGSSRSPSMSGGGVALGPKPRSYAQHTPKKMVRLALLSALSDRADIGRIAVLDDWGIEEPDTREAATILRKLKLKGSVLVVLANDQINLALSLRNLPEASITTHAELSAHDVIKADWLLFSDRTLPTSLSDFSGTHVVEPVEAVPAAEAEKTAAPAKKAAKAEKTATPAKKTAETDAAETAAETDAAETAAETDAETDAAEATPAKKPRATRKAKAVEAEAEPKDDATGAAHAGEAPSEEGDADA